MISDIQSVKDLEFDSRLNIALSGQGHAKFSLLLSMLEQNYLQRLSFVESAEESPEDSRDTFLKSLELSPSTPLKAEEAHWQSQNKIGELLHQGDFANCRLWLSAHPTPLSISDDPLKIPEDVISNCDLYIQNRFIKDTPKEVEVKETGLYDILQSLSFESSVTEAA